MAEFHFTDTIPHPLEACYEAMRDHMCEFTPYLHDVKEIKLLERREVAPGRHYLVNLWVSSYEPPALIRRFVTPEMLRWRDIVTWDDETRSWQWRFESPAFSEVVCCEGTNSMRALGEAATEITLAGRLDILVEKLPGVPSFIGRSVRPQVERFILGLVEPRLRGIDEGLARYLSAVAASAKGPGQAAGTPAPAA